MLSLSKKKKAAPVTKKIKADTDSDSSGSDSDWASKAKGKKPKKKAATRRSISATQSSSDDDGNKSDDFAPPPSTIVSEAPKKTTASDLEEGEVSTSEETEDDTGDEFDDGYDENLMGDAEDRSRLSQMTEKEREQEIFKRIEQREVLKTRFDIEKKLRQAKKKELKKQKKAEGGSSQKFKMDAKERSKERKKTVEGKVDKKSQAMDLLKAKREAKKERAEEKERVRQEEEKKREDLDDELDLKDDVSTYTEKSSKKKLKASDIYSDDSGSSDSDDSSTVKPKREKRDSSSSRSDSDSDQEQKRRRPVYVSTVQDLNRIRLSRSKIEKWVHYPFFDKLAKGTFVRLGIGQSKDNKAVYRITEVLEVVQSSKVYTLGPTRTNKSFRLRYGSTERNFRYEFVSTIDFTQDEFDKWKETCELSNIVLPTMEEIEKKEKELREANTYQFKESDIELIIQEKQKFKQSPVNFAVRKTELMKMKETAQQRGEENRVDELTKELAEIDDRAKELDKARSQSIQSISYINERNRKRNVEQAEKAIMEEIKASKGNKVEDPFTRRNTRPMPMVVNRPLLGITGGGLDPLAIKQEVKLEIKQEPEQTAGDFDEDFKQDAINESQSGADESKANRPPTPEALKDKPSLEMLELDDIKLEIKLEDNIDGKPRTITTGDLFSAHDFDIQLELDAKLPPNLPIVARPSTPQIREPAQRRSLNLEDYKRKRGLI